MENNPKTNLQFLLELSGWSREGEWFVYNPNNRYLHDASRTFLPDLITVNTHGTLVVVRWMCARNGQMREFCTVEEVLDKIDFIKKRNGI